MAVTTTCPCPASYLQAQETKVIDFGGATFSDGYHSSIVCTRQYRPPEVALGMNWTCAVDLWSMGCILVELYTGHVLFGTHDEAEHLAMMERVLGTLPRHLASAAEKRLQRKWFHRGFLLWPDIARGRESELRVRATPRLRDAVRRDRPWSAAHDDFLHLVSGLLEYMPEDRLEAYQALQHPFLSRKLPYGLA